MLLGFKNKQIIWLCVVVLLLVGCSKDVSAIKETEEIGSKGKRILVDVNRKQHVISPMLHGAHLVYHLEADSIYADGRMANLFKDMSISFLRYPGGLVRLWHWNDLTGWGYIDHWNGKYDRKDDLDPSTYMDLDEYMALCRAVGAEPVLGINMDSGWRYNRQEDGLNEAVDLLKYCNEMGYEVNYLFLDNENYMNGWTVEEYAAQINYYVPAIKEQMPNAKLIANWTSQFRSKVHEYKALINIAGHNFDYIDLHWYWKWGVASWDEWLKKTPMEMETEWYDGGTFVEEITFFNQLMASLGAPHVKLACLEWNIPPGKHNEDPYHTPFKTALMQAEMQMQFMQGGLEIASLWTTQWPNDADFPWQLLVKSSNNYEPTPTVEFFRLYKHALGGKLVYSVAEDRRIMTAAVVQRNEKAFVYLLNKNDEDVAISLKLSGCEILGVNQMLSFKAPGVLDDVNTTENNGTLETVLPHYSLSMIELELKIF